MLHGVPIIFLTALITPEEASDGRRIEGHRVAAKPTNSSELIKVVEENLATLRCCMTSHIPARGINQQLRPFIKTSVAVEALKR